MSEAYKDIVAKFENNSTRLMDILLEIQDIEGYIRREAVDFIADAVGLSRADVEETVTFYHFFTEKPLGKYVVYLNDSAVANMMGRTEVAQAFEKAAGCSFGSVTDDGLIGLYDTACIGMNDQEVAAIINGKVFTRITAEKAERLVADMKAGKDVSEMITDLGDGANASDVIKSPVQNNIMKEGAVHFCDYQAGSAVKKAVELSPQDVIDVVTESNLRGRGGAGFPTGMKWGFCSKAKETKRYVFCNADEGEPGTFKDRVLLTEYPEKMIDGMIVAGYAVGASEGIIYLRGEYRYLACKLNNLLDDYRKQRLLGSNVAGKDNFNFNLRIQLGAGAYVCGEESALIESAEGKRGEPRNRPPFPVEVGFQNKPTTVNNVETFSAAAMIVLNGADWFKGMGTKESAGTKLLSVSGDCSKPGVYEVEWGLSVQEMLDMTDAENDVQAVQIGGPSGTCVGPKDFGRKIALEDLPTGGSVIIIGKDRDLLCIVTNFMDFFCDESCGSCAPCRGGTTLIRSRLEKIRNGAGTQSDLDDLIELGDIMKTMNRCGLGQTAANPVVTTIANLPEVYKAKLNEDSDEMPGFNLAAAVSESCEYVGRTPNL